MRPEKIKLYFASFLLLTLIVSTVSYAQNAPPVQINMDVLNALDPSGRKQRPAKTYANELVSFPVTTITRTESPDPSFEKTSNTVKMLIKKEKREYKAMPVLPELKPIKTVKAPLPPKRPKNLTVPVKIKVSDLSIGGMEMPAVPPQKVQAEQLTPQLVKLSSNDELAKHLIIPDKYTMVSSIEAIAALADALMPVSSSAAAQRQIKAARINPAPLPAHKPKMKKSVIVAKIEKSLNVTEIEPASGGNEIKTAPLIDITAAPTTKPSNRRIPRTPPESDFELEYISLPFTPGETALGNDVTGSLNQDIVPLLQGNPQWRLQIQAFAGKTKDGLNKNARRTSLSRALSVRSHLLAQGIEARRMDVRALGMQTDRSPVDRVDFVFFDPNSTN